MSFIINPYAFGGSAPVSFLAGVSVGDNNGATSAAIDTTGASLIVIHLASYAFTPTVSDSQGNTWTGLTQEASGNYYSRLYYVAAPTTSASHTFTVGLGGYSAISVAAFDSTAASPFDAESGASGGQPGSITPSANDSLLVTGMSAEGTSPNINAGFTVASSVDAVPGTNLHSAIAYKVQATASAENPTWTGSAAIQVCTMAAFLHS